MLDQKDTTGMEGVIARSVPVERLSSASNERELTQASAEERPDRPRGTTSTGTVNLPTRTSERLGGQGSILVTALPAEKVG
jgi:hypothetical protein